MDELKILRQALELLERRVEQLEDNQSYMRDRIDDLVETIDRWEDRERFYNL